MKSRIWINALSLISVFLFIAISCSKDETPTPPVVTVPVLTTNAVTSITSTTASSGGNISNDGGASVTARGICWGKSATPTLADSKTTDGTGKGTFTSAIIGLTASTTYYVRAYANNSIGTAYGNAVTFTTLAPTIQVPVLTTTAVTSISSTKATCGGNITSDGGASITERGVCWSSSTNPTLADNKLTVNPPGKGVFSGTISGLTLNTTYYLRAYATNSVGTAYGNELSFITKLAIGDSFQGGIVAYILQPGDTCYKVGETHGFIAAFKDIPVSWTWQGGTTTQETFAKATSLFTGSTNTNTIVTIQGTTSFYAARSCSDYVLGGYSDWYLPSKDELNKLFINKTAIGGFTTHNYWSSSEFLYSTAWSQNLSNGNQTTDYKAISSNVRAVRAF